MSKVFYFDTETTGLDEKVNDIIQIAGIIEIDGKVKEKFEIKMRPIPEIFKAEPEALITHGYSIKDIDGFPSSQEGYVTLIRIFEKYIDKYNKHDKFAPAGYNVDFDTKFLKAFFEKIGDKYYGSWFNWNFIDPIRIVKYLAGNGLLTLPSNKLIDVCAFFNIELTKAHNALADIEATRELKLKMDRMFKIGYLEYLTELSSEQ